MNALTARELQCTQLLADGNCDDSIGAKLKISPRTSRFHIDNAKRKTGAISRCHLVGIAASTGELSVVKISNQAEKIAQNLFQRLLSDGWVKIPPGFKLVPIVPTPEQVLAGAAKKALADRYTAMVDAAPAVFDGQG